MIKVAFQAVPCKFYAFFTKKKFDSLKIPRVQRGGRAVAKLALEHWSCYVWETKAVGVWGLRPQENYAQPHPIDAWKRGVTPFLVY